MSDFFLPEAVMMNIWLRLSIKSTVRFRCVSKSWCASLSDPHFIYKNLTFSDAANEHDILLLVNLECPHYSVVSHETLVATPLQVPPEVPVPDAFFDEHVLTPPCDDLVCFYDCFKYSVGVWNLTTGETKMLPRPVTDNSRFSFVTLGFGYDEKRKEYKVVQILQYLGNFVGYVYSLSSGNNGWRKVGEPSMLYSEVYSRSYREGTFYWGYRDLIVSFDMSTEVFNVISIPFLDGRSSGREEICKLKEGSMFIITCNNYFGPGCTTEYEIWALLELEVTQSWTKLLVIDCGGQEPLGFWRNELIFRSYRNGGLLISDPFKPEVKDVQIDEPGEMSTCLAWSKGKNASINLQKFSPQLKCMASTL